METVNIAYVRELVSLATYFFCFGGGLVLAKLLLIGDNGERSLQKIVGGFSVFLMAIISQSSVVISLSIFVGGLIIASEDFMKFLAAIMKTSSDKIAETVQALNAVQASPTEIKKKAEEESQTLAEDLPTLAQPTPHAGIPPAETAETLPAPEIQESRYEQIEKQRAETLLRIGDLVGNILQNYLGANYASHMLLKNQLGSLLVDGAVIENGEVKRIIEIKYLSKDNFQNLNYITDRFLNRVKKLQLEIPVTMVVVSADLTAVEAQVLKLSSTPSVDYIFFKLRGQDSLELISPLDLSESKLNC